jgi:hypothetical protein
MGRCWQFLGDSTLLEMYLSLEKSMPNYYVTLLFYLSSSWKEMIQETFPIFFYIKRDEAGDNYPRNYYSKK